MKPESKSSLKAEDSLKPVFENPLPHRTTNRIVTDRKDNGVSQMKPWAFLSLRNRVSSLEGGCPSSNKEPVCVPGVCGSMFSNRKSPSSLINDSETSTATIYTRHASDSNMRCILPRKMRTFQSCGGTLFSRSRVRFNSEKCRTSCNIPLISLAKRCYGGYSSCNDNNSTIIKVKPVDDANSTIIKAKPVEYV